MSTKIVPEIIVSFKFDTHLVSNLKHVSNSNDLYHTVKKLFDPNTILWIEEMVLICFNSDLSIVGYYKLSRGGMVSTVADPRVIFTTALNAPCTSIAIAHNHPSGDLEPSPADMQTTDRIKKAGEIIGITLNDHLIITPDSYFSFKDSGLL